MTYNFNMPPANAEELPQYLQTELTNLEAEVNNSPGYTEAQLKSKDSDANRRGKSEGKQVWDSTHKRPVWPIGRSSESAWVDGVGTVVYSPI